MSELLLVVTAVAAFALVLAAVLVVRFLRTGGPAMLKMMGGPPAQASPGG